MRTIARHDDRSARLGNELDESCVLFRFEVSERKRDERTFPETLVIRKHDVDFLQQDERLLDLDRLLSGRQRHVLFHVVRIDNDSPLLPFRLEKARSPRRRTTQRRFFSLADKVTGADATDGRFEILARPPSARRKLKHLEAEFSRRCIDACRLPAPRRALEQDEIRQLFVVAELVVAQRGRRSTAVDGKRRRRQVAPLFFVEEVDDRLLVFVVVAPGEKIVEFADLFLSLSRLDLSNDLALARRLGRYGRYKRAAIVPVKAADAPRWSLMASSSSQARSVRALALLMSPKTSIVELGAYLCDQSSQ